MILAALRSYALLCGNRCVVQATASAVTESYAADPMDQDEGSLSLTASLPLIVAASESCSTDSASLSEEVFVAAPSQDSTEQLEYAIPFQHSRKRVRVCLLYSTMATSTMPCHTMTWSSLSYLCLISLCPMCMYLIQAEIRKANSSQK